MLSINTIARVIVNVVRPATQPTSWDTGLLLVKDAVFAEPGTAAGLLLSGIGIAGGGSGRCAAADL